MSWYNDLKKSPLTPPSPVFRTAWPLLYTLLGLSLILFLERDGSSLGLILFAIHLALNLAWTPIFFTHKRICLSLIIIVLMAIIALAMLVQFYRANPTAAALLVPYLLWLVFAAYLNAYICVHNQRRLSRMFL
jgi:tryptophan-rich sensory protein